MEYEEIQASEPSRSKCNTTFYTGICELCLNSYKDQNVVLPQQQLFSNTFYS